MTTFDPSIAALDHPDHLSGALQQGLPRPMNSKLTWSVIRTFCLGGISGGILPVFFLPHRFRDFAKAEQLQFWHLAEWLRLQTGDAEAAAASQAAKRIMPGMMLRLASLAFLIAAVGVACTALPPHNGAMVPRWWALTLPQLKPADLKLANLKMRSGARSSDDARNWFYDDRNRHGSLHFYSQYQHDFPQDQWHHIYHPDDEVDGYESNGVPSAQAVAIALPPVISPDLIGAFALAVSGAALCWLIEINTHIGRVRRFVDAFNQLSNRYGVGPVRAPGVQLGLRPLWILGAAAICALGGFWAAPVMLAAGAHRRYINGVSLRLRSDLARRQREILLARRPTLRVPASSHLLGTCPRENCRAPYPPEAQYCRRCGIKLEE